MSRKLASGNLVLLYPRMAVDLTRMVNWKTLNEVEEERLLSEVIYRASLYHRFSPLPSNQINNKRGRIGWEI